MKRMDAHDAKAREISHSQTEKCWGNDGEHTKRCNALTNAIANALRDCERETIERAAKVAEDRIFIASLRAVDIAHLSAVASAIRALIAETTGSPDKGSGEHERASNDPGKA